MNKILMKYSNSVLFSSTVCSDDVFQYIVESSHNKSGNAIQKFHQLLIKGLASDQSTHVKTISLLPISSNTHKRLFWNLSTERQSNITYNYLLIINVPIIKNIFVFLLSFLKILFTKKIRTESLTLVCDVLSLSNSMSAFLAAKLRGIKTIAIVTDMPGLDVMEKTFFSNLKTKVITRFLSHFDGYIFITEQMNLVINSKKRPFIVIEGFVDINMQYVNNKLEEKYKERVLLYSGGIYERYGIKDLILAFNQLKDSDLRLHIYGDGPMQKDMPLYTSKDNRVIYKGVVPNKTVVEAQMKATLLINPRPTFEDFTKYSFPSKNMEYMASGTPVITTKLPGMPIEYKDYVYLFEGEDSVSMKNSIQEILKFSPDKLHEFGAKSKYFVMTYKNNIAQATKIQDFIKSITK